MKLKQKIARDKWLALMLKFSKLGDKKKANQCLNSAVQFNNQIK